MWSLVAVLWSHASVCNNNCTVLCRAMGFVRRHCFCGLELGVSGRFRFSLPRGIPASSGGLVRPRPPLDSLTAGLRCRASLAPRKFSEGPVLGSKFGAISVQPCKAAVVFGIPNEDPLSGSVLWPNFGPLYEEEMGRLPKCDHFPGSFFGAHFLELVACRTEGSGSCQQLCPAVARGVPSGKLSNVASDKVLQNQAHTVLRSTLLESSGVSKCCSSIVLGCHRRQSVSVTQTPGHVQEQHMHRQEEKRQADAAALWILDQRVPPRAVPWAACLCLAWPSPSPSLWLDLFVFCKQRGPDFEPICWPRFRDQKLGSV